MSCLILIFAVCYSTIFIYFMLLYLIIWSFKVIVACVHDVTPWAKGDEECKYSKYRQKETPNRLT